MKIARFDATGTPLLAADDDGPCTGGIVFGVGWAHESLPTSGITHLIEHLALSDTDLADRHTNGSTGTNFTHFHTMGTPDKVADFIEQTAAALRNLPMDRMAAEIALIRTEETHQTKYDEDAAIRYGAASYGLTYYKQLGLYRLTHDDLRAYVERYFTAGNAVAYMTSPPPRPLQLNLPPGGRASEPSTRAIVHLPLGVMGPAGEARLTAVVPRSDAAHVFVNAAHRVLLTMMRGTTGLSYATGATYTPWDSASARISLYADSLPELNDSMSSLFLNVLRRLRDEPLANDVLQAVREDISNSAAEPGSVTDYLLNSAIAFMERRPIHTPEESKAAQLAVTPRQLREVTIQLWSSAIVIANTMPQAFTSLGLHGQTPRRAVGDVDQPVIREFTLAPPGDQRIRLRVTADGVTQLEPDEAATVRFAKAAALLTWPDGGRRLIGLDHQSIDVEPSLWQGLTPQLVTQLVDTHIHPSLVVPLPPRGTLPTPVPAGGKPRRQHYVWQSILFAICTGIGVTMTGATIAAAFEIGWAAIILFAIGAPFLVGAAWLLSAMRKR